MTIEWDGKDGWQVYVKPDDNDPPLVRDWKLCLRNVPATEYMSHEVACSRFMIKGPNPYLAYALLEMIADRGYTHDELLICDVEQIREIAKTVATHVGYIQGKASQWDVTKTDQSDTLQTEVEE